MLNLFPYKRPQDSTDFEGESFGVGRGECPLVEFMRFVFTPAGQCCLRMCLWWSYVLCVYSCAREELL